MECIHRGFTNAELFAATVDNELLHQCGLGNSGELFVTTVDNGLSPMWHEQLTRMFESPGSLIMANWFEQCIWQT